MCVSQLERYGCRSLVRFTVREIWIQMFVALHREVWMQMFCVLHSYRGMDADVLCAS